jgi:hypothetical protein
MGKMKIRRVLQPGQPGTKKLAKRYGDNLICVRYRYDDQKMTMFKTIEIVVDQKPWEIDNKKIPENKIISIRVSIDEIELRQKIKACGGKWIPQRKVWQLSYEKVKRLDMTDRIVDDEAL